MQRRLRLPRAEEKAVQQEPIRVDLKRKQCESALSTPLHLGNWNHTRQVIHRRRWRRGRRSPSVRQPISRPMRWRYDPGGAREMPPLLGSGRHRTDAYPDRERMHGADAMLGEQLTDNGATSCGQCGKRGKGWASSYHDHRLPTKGWASSHHAQTPHERRANLAVAFPAHICNDVGRHVAGCGGHTTMEFRPLYKHILTQSSGCELPAWRVSGLGHPASRAPRGAPFKRDCARPVGGTIRRTHLTSTFPFDQQRTNPVSAVAAREPLGYIVSQASLVYRVLWARLFAYRCQGGW